MILTFSLHRVAGSVHRFSSYDAEPKPLHRNLIDYPKHLQAGSFYQKTKAAWIFRAHAFPRISFKLIHTERNTLGLRVESNNLNLDALADLQGVSRVVDAAPRNVGDMQQAVDAA